MHNLWFASIGEIGFFEKFGKFFELPAETPGVIQVNRSGDAWRDPGQPQRRRLA